MKKITALILAIILCFTLAIPALGSEMSVNGQAYSINGIDVYKYPLKASQYFSVEKTIESFATGTQYKMTMRVFKPSGAYTTTTKYNCSRISMDKYEFTETGLYRIVTYAKPTSENDVANSHQFYIRVY